MGDVGIIKYIFIWRWKYLISNLLSKNQIILGTVRKLRGQLQSCIWLFCDPMDYSSPPGSPVHGIFPGKNTRVVCHFILQGIFLTQGSNLHLLGLLHWQVASLLFNLTYKLNSYWIFLKIKWRDKYMYVYVLKFAAFDPCHQINGCDYFDIWSWLVN